MGDTNHKIGELVVRVHHHQKWNKICDTFGTIIDFDKKTLYYTIWWWDDLVMSEKPHIHSANEIFKYKENLKQWLDILCVSK